MFLGDVPITKYETPGGQAFAETIIPVVKKTNVIILANHGTISYGETVEQAYWWTEILDSYCRMLLMARSLGKVNYFPADKERELLDLKGQWGFTDPRNAKEMENCDLCSNDVFRESWESVGIERRAFEPPPPARGRHGEGSPAANGNGADANQERLIQTITDRVMAALQK